MTHSHNIERHETFINYRHFRWLRVNLILIALFIAGYVLHNPIGGRGGGTWYGYISGGFGAAAILYLSWYAIRKRSYHAANSTLRGCLSIHAWLGLSLLFIVPLHCAFEFGWNVHTLAFALMVVTILSGLYGAILYMALPYEIYANRGGGSIKSLLEQLESVEAELGRVLSQAPNSIHTLIDRLNVIFDPSLTKVFRLKISPIDHKSAASLLAAIPQNEQDAALKLISIVERKRDIIVRVIHEVKIMTKIRGWLYVHIPMCAALLTALAIHIFSVFYY
jgi:hypothetical protein